MVVEMTYIKSLEWENKILIDNDKHRPFIQQEPGGVICTLLRRDALRK